MTSIEREPDLAEQTVDADEEMPRLRVPRRTVLVGVLFVVLALAFLYFVLPQIAGLEETWSRIHTGNPWWLAVALLFTIGSFVAYVVQFRFVYTHAGPRVDFRASYQITMAGLAATRIFAAGGAGGIALTAWALRRAGMRRREVADSTIAFLALQYLVYVAALVVVGIGLRTRLLEGPGPFAITVVPAIVGALLLGAAGLLALVPTDVEARLRDWFGRHDRDRLARIGERLAKVPAAVSAGLREGMGHIRLRDPALYGALAFWVCNIAVLWAAFHAFGEAPPWAVIVMAYFVGMLGNLLPLPGGVGGVDGGMIGAFAAFDVDFGLATVAVLTYRGFAFWLPTIPGAVAYFQLRRTVNRWRQGPVLH